jgi:hypothetical protein
VLKKNDSGTTLFTMPFTNSGTLEADTGTLSLTNGGALAGSFVTGSGAVIDFSGGNFTMTGAAPAASGAGLVEFTDNAGIAISGQMTGVLNCAGGMITAPLSIASTGILNISGIGMTLTNDSALTNSGTVNWLTGYVYLATCGAGPLVNLPGAQWNIQSGQSATCSCAANSNAFFLNQGAMLKTNDSGTTIISIKFNNSGALDTATGTLQLTNGGTLGGQFVTGQGAALDFIGGSFSLPGNSLASSGPGQVMFGGTADVSFTQQMSGVLNFAGGTIAGPLTITNGGTLNIRGSVALHGALTNKGTVNWLAGNIYLDTYNAPLAGPVVNLAGGQWIIQCDMSNNCYTNALNTFFTNAGTVFKTNSTGTSYFVNPFNNSGTLKAQTGSIELTGGGVLEGQFVAETNTLIEFDGGSYTLVGAAPAASGPGLVQFNDFYSEITCIGKMSGVLNCALASTAAPLSIASDGTLNITGIGIALNSSLTNEGTINWLAGVVYLNTGSSIDAGPVVNQPGGLWNIQCDQMMSDYNPYPLAPYAWFTNLGTVLKTNTTGTTTIAIPLLNSGTLKADTGTFLLSSGYSETPSANLLIPLSGPTPGTDYGQFQFTSAPAFAGALTVTTQNGYKPAVGATFTVLTYPSFTGAFSSTNLDLNDGMVLQPQFNPGSLVLTAAAATAPTMAISLSPGSVTIQWTPGFSTWVLQSATNLAAPNWTTLSTSGNSTVVSVQPKHQQYFRLHNGP